MTLQEHDALLKEEGRYEEVQERLRQQEANRQQAAEAYRRAEAPLVSELNHAGLKVASVWDLVNTKKSYAEAIPVLLNHLLRPYPDRVREGIARALAVPEARTGWATLLHAFKVDADRTTIGVKWALALALGAAGSDEVLEDILPLMTDKSLGENRAPLLVILGRSKDPRAMALLQQLSDDPDIGNDVKKLLRRLEKRKSRT